MLKYFVIRNFRGTFSSVEILKGYVVRERLGTPVPDFASVMRSQRSKLHHQKTELTIDLHIRLH